MKLRFRHGSLGLAYLFGAVICTGSVISGYFDKDQRWLHWHFSRLGEGGTFSASIFNSTLVVSAVIMYFLGLSIARSISKLSGRYDACITNSTRIIRYSTNTVAVCMIGVSLFPFDRYPVLHNILGYSMLLIFLVLSVFVTKTLPAFSRAFNVYSQAIIPIGIFFYCLFFPLGLITLLTFELIIFAVIYIWFISFIKGIEGAKEFI